MVTGNYNDNEIVSTLIKHIVISIT